MISISLCMIVRDEESTLPRLLESIVNIVDEIIIVDTGSIDQTKKIAKKYTRHVFDFKWIHSFSAARNYSFSKATKDYILWLDADDILRKEDQEKLVRLKETLQLHIDHVTMPYLLAFDENGKVISSLRRNRLVKRTRDFKWIGDVHEYLAVDGTGLDSDVCIVHKKEKKHTDRNLKIYEAKLDRGDTLDVRDLYYYANELKEHAKYEDAIIYYTKMLETELGWIEDRIQACYKLSECYGAIEEKSKQCAAIMKSFELDLPRSQGLCMLGDFFFHQKKYEQSIYWTLLAIKVKDRQTMSITNTIYSSWYPHLLLCLNYDRIGEYVLASKHNEIALQYHPTHKSLLYNRKYFADVHHLTADSIGGKT